MRRTASGKKRFLWGLKQLLKEFQGGHALKYVNFWAV